MNRARARDVAVAGSRRGRLALTHMAMRYANPRQTTFWHLVPMHPVNEWSSLCVCIEYGATPKPRTPLVHSVKYCIHCIFVVDRQKNNKKRRVMGAHGRKR